MSGTQVSAWQTPNELLTSMQTPALVLHNQLANQGAQQELNAAEMEQLSRASNWVISQDPENKDPAKQAAAYSTAVGILQKNGYAKQAPDVYPGFEHMQLFARMGTPSAEQFKLGQAGTAIPTPGFGPGAAAPPGGAGGGGTAPSQLAIPARGIGGPGSSAEMPPELLPAFREASQTYNIPMELLIAQARQESGFRMIPGGSGEIGIMQIMPSTARGMGLDPASLNDPRANILAGARYLRERAGADADMNDPAVQARALHAYNGGGDPNYVANVNRYRPGFSPSDPSARVTTYAAAPPAAPGGGTTPPPYRVAQAGPLTTQPPTASTAAPAAPPAPVTTTEPETQLPVLSAPPNQVMPGQPNGPSAAPPPAVTPTSQQPAQQPPAIGPVAIPAPPAMDQNNLTRQDYADLDRARRTGMSGPQLTQEVQQRQNANLIRQHQYQSDVRQAQNDAQAANEKAKADAIAAENLRLSQVTSQREQEAAAALAEQRRVENQRAAETQRLAQEEARRRQVKADQEAVLAGRPFQGQGADVQNRNILIEGTRSGKTDTPEYQSAWADYAQEKRDPNGLAFKPDMSPYATPTGKVYGEGKGGRDLGKTDTSQAALAPQPVMTGMLLNATGQNKITAALTALEAYPGAVGLKGSAPDAILQRLDPEGVPLRAAIANLQVHEFHSMAGAAQSPSESARLQKYVPSQTDSAAAIRTKLTQLMDLNRDTLLQSYRSYGPDSGFRKNVVIEEAILGSIPDAAMERLKKEPNTVKQFDQIYGKGAGKLVLDNG